MEQLDPRQIKNKPMFDVIEPSIVRAHFASKKDVSFSSYLKPQNNHNNINKFNDVNIQNNKTEESDQISIFDAAKYFSGLNDNQQQQQQRDDIVPIPPRLSSVETSSNYGGRNSYRTRSFHATPTASSEASWNSQTGLLTNPPGSVGIRIIKSFSNNSNGSPGTNNSSAKWPRISTKWLNKGRKCPCLGKKSVQVDERIDSKTMPRMVDLRQSTSNGTNTLYSPRQSSPKSLCTTLPSSTTRILAKNPIEKIGYPYNSNNNNNNNDNNNNNQSNVGFSSLGLNSKVVGPLKLYDDLAKVGGGGDGDGVASNNVVVAPTTTVAATATATAIATSNGFTFPILENPPVGVKKMFNVIPPLSHHHINDEPHRDSLEVFQPRSHPSPNKSRRTSYEDENVSDGSSDLFEIECFSTSTYPYRDSMDEVVVSSSNFGTSMKRLGIICPSYNNNNSNNQFKHNNNNGNDYVDEEPMTPSVAPTDCYAPSEVSIDWSVTTAEGFDRGSLSNYSASASEFAYAAMRREAEQYRSGGDGEECKGWHNSSNSKAIGKNSSSGGLLLGCRNEKAVSVGPSPIKCLAQEGPLVAARHVSGGPQVVRAPHINGNGNSKPSVVVGRSRSTNILPMPFVT